MRKNKKQRIRNKREIIKNRKMVKKYPWLKPWRRWYRNREQYGWDNRMKYQYITWYGWPDGWNKAFGSQFLEEINDVIKRDNIKNFHVLDMKEKWGMARIDVSGFNDEILNIINKYEELSQSICCFCGKPNAVMINKGWIIPLCFDCYKNKWNRSNKSEEELLIKYNEYRG